MSESETGTSVETGTSAEIRTLLVTKFGTDPDAIRPDVPLHRLRLDSLALEELRLHIEDRLDVDLEDTALTSRDTVGRLVEVVHAKVSA
ncbi:acyl carrier protein [Streptomyces sp. V2I9]|uniref:acyl carrier protein n=1 Tax=Streptomyces sp. V2I9 TaxID=3042304 RepID=UPI0027D899B2|nr:acyl carrier protein [Streptomyces sp. V2I9]